MNYNPLFENDGPAFYVIELAPEGVMPLRRELAQAFPAATVRVIRCDKSTDEESFFNEAGAALQFPGDFVELWENFGAYIDDLSWLPGGPIVLLFTFAPYLLCDESPGVFNELVEQLDRAAKNRANGSLKALFQAAPDDLAAFLDRFETSGKGLAVLIH